jgi:rod shape-determining protein MreD
VTSRTIVINIIRFVFLIFFQVLILNNVNLGGFINPLYYVYFILLLPFALSRWALLVSSFILGFGIDLFTNTPGLNAAACVVMAFARPYVINLISTSTESLIGINPTIKNQGIKWFFYYSAILILIHHTTLFYLEVFRFDEFFRTFLRVILSSTFTLLLVLLSEYLLFRKEK